MIYYIVKYAHVAVVCVTSALFVVRVAWMLWSPAHLNVRWVRILPHVVDTVLLISGLWMALQLGLAGVRGWLPAKMVALALYIVLGALAIKRARTRRLRFACAVAA